MGVIGNMARSSTTFKKGQGGKPKGAETMVKKEARGLFLQIMEGEIDHVQDALDKVRQRDPARYLDILAKLMPFFIPKQLEVKDTTPDKVNIPVIAWLKPDGKT